MTLVSLFYFNAAILLVISWQATSSLAFPVKRVGQTLAASTTKWQAACRSAGGGLICTTLADAAEISLVASAGPCDQQDSADTMMNLAHNLGSPADLIAYTQIYAQQPRDTAGSFSTPYCQRAPKNSELDGLYQCQYKGSSHTVFSGGVKIGHYGTIPYGLTHTISPHGGCPAHPTGPIAAASQLTDITNNPGLENIVFHRSATSTVTMLQKTATVNAPRPSLSLQ